MNARSILVAAFAASTLAVACSAAPAPGGEETGATEEAMPKGGPGQCVSANCFRGCGAPTERNGATLFDYGLTSLGCDGHEQFAYWGNDRQTSWWSITQCPASRNAWVPCPAYPYNKDSNGMGWVTTNIDGYAWCWSQTAPIYSRVRASNLCLGVSAGNKEIAYDPNCSGGTCM